MYIIDYKASSFNLLHKQIFGLRMFTNRQTNVISTRGSRNLENEKSTTYITNK